MQPSGPGVHITRPNEIGSYRLSQIKDKVMVPVIVNGAYGKMGSLACETLNQDARFELIGRLGREDNLAQAIQEMQPAVVVDLTNADSVYENTRLIIEMGVHPVIGTSGLLTEQISELQNLCLQQNLGGIIVPNFSISAVLMMSFAAKAAAYFTEVEIIEAHHQQKLDAPSGTAIKTAELIAANQNKPRNCLQTRELIAGARGANHQKINIHSIRLPGILARQEVLFGNKGETLSIIDNSISRECYMPGLLLSCEKVCSLDHLVYGLEHIL